MGHESLSCFLKHFVYDDVQFCSLYNLFVYLLVIIFVTRVVSSSKKILKKHINSLFSFNLDLKNGVV